MKKQAAILLFVLLFACTPEQPEVPEGPEEEEVVDDPGQEEGKDNEDEPQGYSPSETDVWALVDKESYGLDYIYDRSSVPELHISISDEQWQTLLDAFDADNATTEQVHADLSFCRDGITTTVMDSGLRLKGNVFSRRRPQSGSGRFQHVHYQVNFHKFNKDDAHSVHGCRKISFKWFKDDPSYVREILAYDIFRDAKVWTASLNTYCKLYITVGNASEKYLGVYDAIEHLDEQYLKSRKALFGSAKGNLWKARYGASFAHVQDDFGADLGDGVEHRYELKTNTEQYPAAYDQIQDFIKNYTTLRDDEFHTWVSSHVDVPLLLRTYAVIVATGFWDDYWCDSNNFYFYFNSTDGHDYTFYYIPYDCDNTFGIGNGGLEYAALAPATQDPFKWGHTSNPLITRLLKFDDFAEIYRAELLRMIDPDKGIMDPESAIAKVKDLQRMIKGLTDNDTGEDCTVVDKVPSWSCTDYKLISGGQNYNFFKVKEKSLKEYLL